jgi:membrane protease YdiL (CAAX protease family)
MGLLVTVPGTKGEELLTDKIKSKTALQVVIGTFGVTWFFWGIILVANQFGYLEFSRDSVASMIPFTLGGLAPSIVVFVVLLKGKTMSVKELFKTVFAVKQPISMYLIMVGFFALYIGLSVFSGVISPFSPVYLLTFPIMIIGGGLEEVGWRYVLQPSLEKKLPFAVASLITGVIWAIWHLPLFLIKGTHQSDFMNFGLYLLLILGLAFALAADFRISNCVWLCVLFHALVNAPLEDPACSWNIGGFDDIVPVIITALILVTASCVAVLSCRRNNHQAPPCL